jgi:hypothetical protein
MQETTSYTIAIVLLALTGAGMLGIVWYRRLRG